MTSLLSTSKLAEIKAEEAARAPEERVAVAVHAHGEVGE
jgi:hypothetical protein